MLVAWKPATISNYRYLCALLYIIESGLKWKVFLNNYKNRNSVYIKFSRWSKTAQSKNLWWNTEYEPYWYQYGLPLYQQHQHQSPPRSCRSPQNFILVEPCFLFHLRKIRFDCPSGFRSPYKFVIVTATEFKININKHLEIIAK